MMPQRPDDVDPIRWRLAEQAIVECERRGLKVWADFGVGFVGQPGPNGEMLPAPTHWRRIVEALGFEIACAIGDQEGSYLAPVERLPGGCLLYRMAWRDAEVDRVIGRAPSAAPIPDPEVAA